MQRHRQLTLQRLENYKAVLEAHIYDAAQPLEMTVYAASGRITYTEALAGTYEPLALHHRFGPLWSTHWVRVAYTVPAAWAGREVHLRWDASAEATVWQAGQPIQGLSGTGPHWNSPYHTTLILTQAASADVSGELYIEVAANTPFGQLDPGPNSDLGLLRLAEIAPFRRDVWDLYWDFVVIADIAAQLPADSPRAGRALAVANAMINVFQPSDPASIAAARAHAAPFLGEANGTGDHKVFAVGHAHIDTAWLWPIAETRRKCVRSFTTALHLMDRYPDYTFVCSQAQQLAWIKADHPQLYARIQARAADGRFVLVGGAWVEPDCNLPSGEALIRQFLYGQRFYQAEFGAMHDNFWLPDTFGYSPALPQIMQGVGIRYFLTQKLSWNQFNKLPANTFYWEGLDGSRVLTHFPPADTYNGLGNVREIVAGTQRFRDHDRSDASMYIFGFGDGGGGPSAPMLEQLARMSDVNGLPTVQQRAPSAFFQHVEATANDLTNWVGELYFEAHRGTYTTHAYIKWGNRRGQQRLHDAELLAVLTGSPLRDALTPVWERLLLNQFHDILPGSSIKEVFNDAQADYEWILAESATHIDAALAQLLPQTTSDDAFTVVNTLAQARDAIIELPFERPSAQTSAAGAPLALVSAPALGYQQQRSANNPTQPSASLTESGEGYVFDNEHLRVHIGSDGHVHSLYHKRLAREALAEPANQFVLYEDRPVDWDAWDIDAFALEKPMPIGPATSATVTETGPLRVAVHFTYAFSNSTLSQTISLTAIDDVLVFDTQVEWQEDHQLLKVEFPLAVRAPNALYETQFGYVERPTHRNTSWDVARFEVCAQRWAALREYGFGVALLNESKHGHSTLGNRMALSLLRAPKHPDPTADRGSHQFRYGLMPFAGDLPYVVHAAAAFDAPLYAVPRSAARPSYSAFSVDREHVIIDTVKHAEDDDAVIVRVYEACGGRGPVTLRSGAALLTAQRCDLLERAQADVPIADNTLSFDIQPFQIITFKLTLGEQPT